MEKSSFRNTCFEFGVPHAGTAMSLLGGSRKYTLLYGYDFVGTLTDMKYERDYALLLVHGASSEEIGPCQQMGSRHRVAATATILFCQLH